MNNDNMNAAARVKELEAALKELYLAAHAVLRLHPLSPNPDEHWPDEIGSLAAILTKTVPVLVPADALEAAKPAGEPSEVSDHGEALPASLNPTGFPEGHCFGCGFVHAVDYPDCVHEKEI